jgi:hypothetical protein
VILSKRVGDIYKGSQIIADGLETDPIVFLVQ